MSLNEDKGVDTIHTPRSNDHARGGRTERVFATAGDWALGADSLQWILYRKHSRKRGDSWDPVSFVSSERDILARCMREKGVDPGTASRLLSGLPDTFNQWKTSQPSFSTHLRNDLARVSRKNLA